MKNSNYFWKSFTETEKFSCFDNKSHSLFFNTLLTIYKLTSKFESNLFGVGYVWIFIVPRKVSMGKLDTGFAIHISNHSQVEYPGYQSPILFVLLLIDRFWRPDFRAAFISGPSWQGAAATGVQGVGKWGSIQRNGQRTRWQEKIKLTRLLISSPMTADRTHVVLRTP